MLEHVIAHPYFPAGIVALLMSLILVGAGYILKLSERRDNIFYELENISSILENKGIDVSAQRLNSLSNLKRAVTQQFLEESRLFIVFYCVLAILFFMLFFVS